MGKLLGMELVLERHVLETNLDLNFEAYRYQLWNRTWDGAALRAIHCEVLLLAAFAMQKELGITEGMLTYDSQRLLARYDLVANEWCDTTSGKPIDPIGHLVTIFGQVETLV